MDYLKERLPLVDDNHKDIKKFKAKLIDTMYLHQDNLTTIDRLRKLQMEMDQCIIDTKNKTSSSSIKKMDLFNHAPIAFFITLMFWLYYVTDLNLPFMFHTKAIAFFSVFIFAFIIICVVTSFIQKICTEPSNDDTTITYTMQIQDMKDICDVLIHLHRNK